MKIDTLAKWHELLGKHNPQALEALLAEDVVFISPVVHTPQVGKAITKKYLLAAFHVLFNDSFEYLRELKDEHGAILEFQTVIDGISMNGVDMMKWNAQGEITEFKVMVRPLKAVNLLHQKMGEMLTAAKS